MAVAAGLLAPLAAAPALADTQVGCEVPLHDVQMQGYRTPITVREIQTVNNA